MARESSIKATQTIIAFHKKAEKLAQSFQHHAHAYVWNDSAALLAYLNDPKENCTPIMKEADNFMTEIDRIQTCYGVSVYGQAFPHPPSSAKNSKFIFLSISSYAFGNCDKILKELGTHRRRWYVDGRIIRRLPHATEGKVSYLNMLPKYYKRDIHMYEKSPWDV